MHFKSSEQISLDPPKQSQRSNECLAEALGASSLKHKEIFPVLTAGTGWEGKSKDSTYRKYKFTLFIHCYHHEQFGRLSVSRYLSKAGFPGTKGPQQTCRLYLSWSIDVFEELNFINLYSCSSIHCKEKKLISSNAFSKGHWYHDSEVNRDSTVLISATITLFFVPAAGSYVSLLCDRCSINRKSLLVYIDACKRIVFVESLLKIQNIYVILLYLSYSALGS